MHTMKTDTICAIATPAGMGGIAVLRIAGPEACALADSLLRHPDGTPLRLRPRHATFAHLLLDDGQLLDEVVATLFTAPHSYCGDDTVELACHGSPYVQQRALQLLVEHGARLAEPGEFTQRAFLNGRLDLSQAEAVADLIDARSQAAHSLAVSQMRGGYARELAALRQQLVDLTALLELELDFSDEDLEFVDRTQFRTLLTTLRARVRQLLDSFRAGNAIRQGVPVAIIGRPNAGKSSLLNALLADERAIVSPIPGTTRDTIEETLVVEGILLRIIDTAGLRNSDDPIEALGCQRAIQAVERASIVLFVRDATKPSKVALSADFPTLVEAMLHTDRRLIEIDNKSDLLISPTGEGMLVSALTGAGIDDLRHAIAAAARSLVPRHEGPMLSNLRHYEALRHVDTSLGAVEDAMQQDLPSDLIAVDLRSALYHLGTITGEVSSDDILASIFSRFCIGK
ncbi:MAG: tRNA uridine-5-carboxymethylaminomethyl(34) synthesis GTPase MnmE [Bacteroidales bacterium]|nr:tRNA uridine-5-carboxymethylaminomethyl(34) synthesis GTPase MnmE [Bacteroidales bacterium]